MPEGEEGGAGGSTATADKPAGGTFDDMNPIVDAGGDGAGAADGGLDADGDHGGVEGDAGDGSDGGEGGEPKLIAGKYKDLKEFEAKHAELDSRYAESSKEGMRLYQESKTLRAELKAREDRIADLERQVKEALERPAFRELSKEELKALHEADPLAAVEYLADKKLRDRDIAAQKKSSDESSARQKREREETESFVESRIEAMSGDAQNYPDFLKLQPLMESINKRADGMLSGFRWTADLLYYAARGYQAVEAHRKGLKAKPGADAEAKRKAAAAAAAGGSSGGGAGGSPPKKVDPNSDEAFNDRLITGASKKLFG